MIIYYTCIQLTYINYSKFIKKEIYNKLFTIFILHRKFIYTPSILCSFFQLFSMIKTICKIWYSEHFRIMC